jgi:hypothetical protein
MVVKLYLVENSLSDIYQTILSFGNYIQIQYLSDRINFEINFENDYEVEFLNIYGKDELVINSTETSNIVTISDYKTIDVICHSDDYITFKIELLQDTYLFIIVSQ